MHAEHVLDVDSTLEEPVAQMHGFVWRERRLALSTMAHSPSSWWQILPLRFTYLRKFHSSKVHH
jgi:hypothetical protein